MGIPEENSIGVSTADIRKLAKEIGRSNELAFALWQTGYPETRLLYRITEAGIHDRLVKNGGKYVAMWTVSQALK